MTEVFPGLEIHDVQHPEEIENAPALCAARHDLPGPGVQIEMERFRLRKTDLPQRQIATANFAAGGGLFNPFGCLRLCGLKQPGSRPLLCGSGGQHWHHATTVRLNQTIECPTAGAARDAPEYPAVLSCQTGLGKSPLIPEMQIQRLLHGG